MCSGDAEDTGAVRPDSDDLAEIRRLLLSWWERNQRSFPWRETRNPWHILLAEVLLHRTRADQVVPVYRIMVEKFPDPDALMRSPAGELESIVHPLGLRWRVPLLREMARQIVQRYGGKIPEEKEALRSLAGVSDYIAGAVRCFASGLPEPLLDTNTVRVLGRIRGWPISDGSRRSRHFHRLMQEFVDCADPRSAVLALLDLAALVCRPRNPECGKCPLRDLCQFGRTHGNTKRDSGSAGP
ncbi:hypothetical protein [uncultured Thermanaerothrix sp.]|uniref:hypothetical protein n=1 Tax=uncultured Thermanaerothrix sp. TaxID=1195149 RepID=UPI002625BF37|nr:hypothetical protein [uncultured Thermanaerothrix sp.]